MIGVSVHTCKGKAGSRRRRKRNPVEMAQELTILHSPDAEDLAFRIFHHYSPLMTTRTECLSTLSYPVKPSKMQTFIKSKVSLVLISPGLLAFACDYQQNAQSIFQLLKPTTTTGLFCCGAEEDDVTICHKAVMSNYSNWTRVTMDEGAEFFQYALTVLDQTISNVRCTSTTSPVRRHTMQLQKIVLVPKRVTQVERCVYAIFTQNIENEEIFVMLEKEGVSEALIQCINPYVIGFTISDYHVQSPGPITVRINCGKQLLLEARLQCVFSDRDSDLVDYYGEFENTLEGLTDSIYAPQKSVQTYRTLSANSADLDGNNVETRDYIPGMNGQGSAPCFLNLPSPDTPTENSNTYPTPSTIVDDDHYADMTKEYLNLYQNFSRQQSAAQAALQHELNIKLDETQNSAGNQIHVTLKRVSTIRTNSQESLYRSMSLPSLLSPETLYPNYIDSHYEDMTTYRPILQVQKPHEKLLESLFQSEGNQLSDGLQNLMYNQDYVTMIRDSILQDNTATEHEDGVELSVSQRELVELLEAFKRGVKTLSEVENHFQDWLHKHRRSLEEKERSERERYGARDEPFGLAKIKRKMSKIIKKKGRKRKESAKQPEEITYERRSRSLSKLSYSSNSSASSAKSEQWEPVRTNDSEVSSDTGEDFLRKVSTVGCVHQRKPDEKNTVWFAPFPVSMLCRNPSEEAPYYHSPGKPPPLANLKKRIPMYHAARSPSPDYIYPNIHNCKTSPLPRKVYSPSKTVACLCENTGNSIPFRKFSAPEMQPLEKNRERVNSMWKMMSACQIGELPRDLLNPMRQSSSDPQLVEQPIYMEICRDSHNSIRRGETQYYQH